MRAQPAQQCRGGVCCIVCSMWRSACKSPVKTRRRGSFFLYSRDPSSAVIGSWSCHLLTTRCRLTQDQRNATNHRIKLIISQKQCPYHGCLALLRQPSIRIPARTSAPLQRSVSIRVASSRASFEDLSCAGDRYATKKWAVVSLHSNRPAFMGHPAIEPPGNLSRACFECL